MAYPKYDSTQTVPYCVNAKGKLRLSLDIVADDLKDIGKVLSLLGLEIANDHQDTNALGEIYDDASKSYATFEFDIMEN